MSTYEDHVQDAREERTRFNNEYLTDCAVEEMKAEFDDPRCAYAEFFDEDPDNYNEMTWAEVWDLIYKYYLEEA